MWDLFKAEIIRFRAWAIAYAVLQLLVLAFMTRVVDLAQQPLMIYQVVGGVYALTGLLLGLYQIGGYRRPNAWLNLLHRPLPHWQVAAALFGAGTLLLLVAVLLPVLVIAGWQEAMTARVLDTRHLWLALSGLLIAVCGYFAGGYTMLGNKRYSVCALMLLALLAFSNATGIEAIGLQLLVLAWLAMMIVFAFKPDLSTLPRHVPGVIATTVPLQMTLWFALLLVGFGVEMVWIMQGSHPNNLATPLAGGTKEANFAEGKDLMIAGLRNSTAAEAPLWREQAAISEVFTLGPSMERVPARNELTNIAPMEFDDETRRVRWVFSHDSMRFEGYSLADFRAVGQLGVEGKGAFPTPPLPGPDGTLLSRNALYQYESDARLVLPRAQLPADEVITGFQVIGERIALLSDRALYVYDGRELQNGDGLLTARQRVPLPARTGNLTRVDLMELLDGYLVSFTYTMWSHNGNGAPFQQVFRVDGPGQVSPVARRDFRMDYPLAWRYQTWYASPLLFALKDATVDLFADYAPARNIERPPVPRGAMLIAGALLLLSMLCAIWRTQRVDMSTPARIAWILACGVIGVPALLSLWLLYPQRERLDNLTIPKVFGAVPALALIAALLIALPPSASAKSVQDADDAAQLRIAVAAQSTRPRAPRFDRTVFLARPALRDVALSPDGGSVATLREQGPNRSVWLLPAAGGKETRVLANTEAERVLWSHDSRWLFLETSRQVFALAVAGQGGSGVIAALGGRNKRELFAIDPSLPAALIIFERPPIISRQAKRWRLYRVDVHGKQQLLREDAKQIVDFALDPRGRLAFVLRAEGETHVVQRIDAQGRLHPAMRCVRMERCQLIGTVNNGRDLLMRSNAGGNFLRLARLDADDTVHVLHDDPRGEADVQDIELDPLTQQPLLVGYASTIAANYGLTPDAKRHVDVISRRFPQRYLRIEAAHGPDAYWLVRERAGSLKGEHLHLYDPRAGSFRLVLDDKGFANGDKPAPALPESAMARKIAFAWRASDGMRLHGFLMLPPGIDASKAPLVAGIHGGPFNVVRPDFSNDGQFLANRGYVVFQPNFRGSTGHGREYQLAAKGDFGNGRVQQDIVEGVRYLLAQGIGDPRRVGITGASFGGYSTLVGVTFQPELFKVGVAAVPPADFGWTLREYLGTGSEMIPGIPMATSMRHLSLDPTDQAIAKRLTEQSPIANASKLHQPVLMLAGGEDERVPIRGVTHYAAKLKSLGKDVTLFVDDEAGHSPGEPRTREAYYYLMELLMHRHLGGAAPNPPSRELRAHLRKHLRLTGSDVVL